MASDLLASKLHAPHAGHGHVTRPRLAERMSRVLEARVTLVSAPAGFGKTTLVADWLATTTATVAWVSLDATDDDPRTFWRYVLAALDRVLPGVGQQAIAQHDRPDVAIGATLTTLLNDLSGVAADVVLVLDDYHLIGSAEVHEGIAFLVDHLPPRVHLAITTRSDPPLALARLRARGQLVEIRAADLRFTSDETAAYLGGPMGLALDARDLAVLETRTEGWIAALQLAALSMQGRDDTTAFIREFAGDDRYIVDYLVEEVLSRQDDGVRSFLLRTSILERMCGPLCDAVTGQPDGAAMLETLDRANLFLVPLDDRRRWFRYHHLFADVLRTRLRDEGDERVADLHRRAGAWHEAEGDWEPAVRHIVAAGDFDRAAELMERVTFDMNRARQEWPLRRLHESLPPGIHAERPVLALGYVGVLMSTGSTEGVAELLDDAERASQRPFPGRDTPAGARLPALIAMHRAGLFQLQGDADGAITQARRAIEVAADDDHLSHGGAASLIALAMWTTGDVRGAETAYAEGMARIAKAGYEADVVGGAVSAGDLLIAQGRLRDAVLAYERGLGRATRGGGEPLRGAADMHVGLAAVAYERDDLELAADHLRRSHQLGEANGMPKHPCRWRLGEAALHAVRGDLEGALVLLDEAERRYDGDFSPDVRPVTAIRARMWIAHGRLREARTWAVERGLAPDDEPSYLREYEHATLARLLVQEGRQDRARMDEAVGVIDRLLPPARAAGRMGAVIDLLAVRATASRLSGDQKGAFEALAEAAALAEPEGHVRVFLDEGTPMVELIRATAARPDAPSGIRRLAEHVGGSPGQPPSSIPGNEALIEPLSERELEVLRLLDSDLDGPEIADRLYLSLNTVRTHTRHIYEKLGVGSRRAAVSRAAQLGLLSRDRERST